MGKRVYKITLLNGYDDDTVFEMELTELEYELLQRVAGKVNEKTSDYCRMSRMYVEDVNNEQHD